MAGNRNDNKKKTRTNFEKLSNFSTFHFKTSAELNEINLLHFESHYKTTEIEY